MKGDVHGAAQLTLTAVAVFIARLVDVQRIFDWGFCLAMAFNGWGHALHLFSDFWWYDNVVHINLPCFLAVLLTGAAVTRLSALEPAAPATAQLLPATSALTREYDLDDLRRRVGELADRTRAELGLGRQPRARQWRRLLSWGSGRLAWTDCLRCGWTIDSGTPVD